MGHKIFSDVLFSQFYFLSLGGWSTKYPKEHQGDLKKTRHYKQITSTHPLSRYETNSGKNFKKCLMHFDPNAKIFVLSN